MPGRGTKILHATGQLSPHAANYWAHALWSLHATTREACVPHWKIPHATMKIPHAATKTQCSQINKYKKKKTFPPNWTLPTHLLYESSITLIAKSGKDTKTTTTTTTKTYQPIFFMNIHAKILNKISANWIQHIKGIAHHNKRDLLIESNNSSTYKNWSV